MFLLPCVKLSREVPRLYKIEILPVARKDMLDTVFYISTKLSNPKAASDLAEELTKKINSLAKRPYINPVYIPIRPLKHDYRKQIVKNYIVFYWVDEETETVTVARVIYSKRNYSVSSDFFLGH